MAISVSYRSAITPDAYKLDLTQVVIVKFGYYYFFEIKGYTIYFSFFGINVI